MFLVRFLFSLMLIVLLTGQADARGWRRSSGGGHAALVAESGITPRQIGSAEGVGMSTRSYIDARNNACFWGQRTPVSIQYSYRNGRYYAVVRYR